MFRSLWFHNLLGINSRRNRRREAAQQRRTVRPTLEGLEDRITPSALPAGTPTITVTNGGPVTNTRSLAHAIQQVDNATNGSFILNITKDITLAQNNPYINSNSVVDLVGNGHTITNGSGVPGRLFTVGTGGVVYFSNLTLTGGKVSGTEGNFDNSGGNASFTPGATTSNSSVDGGGAIADFGGTVSLTNDTITGNTAYAANSKAYAILGGGIFINGGGQMFLNGTNTISSNSALAQTIHSSTPVATVEAEGGGVYLSGSPVDDGGVVPNINNNQNGVSSFTVEPATPTVNSTLVMIKNTAQGGSTTSSEFTAVGGAIADSGGTVILTKAQIGGATSASANTVGVLNNVLVSTPGRGVYGGGIAVLGYTDDEAQDAPEGVTPLLTIDNSSITYNSASGGGSTAATGGFAAGGGLAVSDATVQVLDTTFAGNSVTAGQSGAANYGIGAGGGVSVSGGGTVYLTNDAIVNNTATGNGSPTTNTTYVAQGGGVSISNSTVTLLNSIAQGNTANGKPMDVFGLLGTGATYTTGVTGSQQDILGNVNSTNSSNGGATTTSKGNTVLSGYTNVFVTPTLQVSTALSTSKISTALYYPLIANSLAINNANPAANNTIAAAEHVDTDATFDEAGNARTANKGANMDIGPVQFNTSPAPAITTQPANQTGVVGGSVTFTAAASGSPNPTVQWEVSSDGGKTFTTIPGQTGDTLTVSGLTLGMSGNEYEAIFTNSIGSKTTNPATLTVNQAASITTNPKSQTGTVGGSVTFTAAASGTPTPTNVKWEVSTDGGKTFTTVPGQTNPTLTLSNLTLSMNGNEYEAIFSNGVGSPATSSPATLTVNTGPSITTQPTNQTVTAGNTATFTAAANGNPTPTLSKWEVSTDGGKTFTTLTGQTSPTLKLSNVTSDMNGNEYEAVFSNGVGSPATSNPATLTVNTSPTVVVTPISQTVATGNTATFTAVVTGNPAPTLQWEFSSNGGATFTTLAGQTGTTLTLNNVSSAMSGLYEAIATNGVGTPQTSNVVSLTVTSTSVSVSPSVSPSVTQLTPLQAAFEVAIDVAAIVLELNGNTTQLALLSALAPRLVPGFTLPTTLSGLFADGQAAYTLAGPLGLSAIQAGISFANSSSTSSV